MEPAPQRLHTPLPSSSPESEITFHHRFLYHRLFGSTVISLAEKGPHYSMCAGMGSRIKEEEASALLDKSMLGCPSPSAPNSNSFPLCWEGRNIVFPTVQGGCDTNWPNSLQKAGKEKNFASVPISSPHKKGPCLELQPPRIRE